MAEWTSCPHCNLKHSARADGLCPRCRKPVSSAAAFEAPPAPRPEPLAPSSGTVYAPPEPPAAPGETMFDPAAAPAGGGTVYSPSSAPSGGSAGRSPSAPSAGSGAVDGVPLGARIAGGVLVLNAIALMAGGQMMAAGGARRISSIVIDLILGVMVIIGNEGALTWTKIRVAFGAIVFSGLLIAQGDIVSAGFQLAFSGALLMLLIGEARGLRLGLGASVAAVYFIVAVLGMGQ